MWPVYKRRAGPHIFASFSINLAVCVYRMNLIADVPCGLVFDELFGVQMM